MRSKPGLLSLAAIASLIVVGCATFERSAYITLGTTAHTVDMLMTTWADESAAGRTTPALDASVVRAYTNYQNSMALTRIAIDAYRGGTNSQSRVEKALTDLASNKEAIRNIILSIALPQKSRTQVLKAP